MIMNNILENDFFCRFVQLSDGLFKCSKCGIVVNTTDIHTNTPPEIPCLNPFAGEDNNSTIENLQSLHKEDKDVCDINVLNHRYDICQKCEFLENNTCTQCGCFITRNIEYMNKLVHKDQTCPINKW
jgi:hypothetical protein